MHIQCTPLAQKRFYGCIVARRGFGETSHTFRIWPEDRSPYIPASGEIVEWESKPSALETVRKEAERARKRLGITFVENLHAA